MAPITTASDENTHMALLDKLDMAKIHKSFRNPAYKAPQRRNKNLKQILSEASRREAASHAPSGTGTPTAAGESLHPNPAQGSSDVSKAVLSKNASIANGSSLTPAPYTAAAYSYTSIAAAPSLKPKQKYCDVTGLPARYSDPKTGLRYCNKEIYAVLRGLGTQQVQEYLGARGANTVLK